MTELDEREEDQGGYWSVLPGEVLQDRELPHAGKLLYAILAGKANKKGYCWPSNAWLSEALCLSKRRVVELLAQLSERGYIRIEMTYKPGTNQIERRYIYCGIFVCLGQTANQREGASCLTSPCEDSHDPPAESRVPPCEISHDPPAKNTFPIKRMKDKEENKKDNILSPSAKGPKAGVSLPKYQPEWFEWFYSEAYPRKASRKAACKAWDKLKPDRELCRVMKRAIERQKQSAQWMQGEEHIPHFATWLNGERWLDEVRAVKPTESPPSTGGWAPDPEVY